MIQAISRSHRTITQRIRLSSRREIASYTEQYRRSLDKPEEFWAEAAEDLHWFKPWSKVLDTSKGPSSRWFTGGEMNTSYNALDVHVQNGRGGVVALHYDSPLTSTKMTKTYSQLLKEVATFAGGLQKLGVKKGDRVVIYMPAVLETTVAMLACARLGAVHSVVFGGFATLELAARIEDATPKVIISASCGVEPKGIIDYGPLLNGAIERSAWKPSKVVMMQRDLCPFPMKKGRDVDWRDVMAMGDAVDAVPVLATDPLYILYTSGTTGRPKGVVRDNGGHAVALKWAMHNVFGITPDDTFFAASDMGWTVGHSLVVYGPLVHGCTSVLYAGKPVGTPDAGAYWRLITEYGIKSMFTAPTALRAIRKEDPHALLLKDKKEEIRKTLETMFVAGERGDPKTFNFFSEELGNDDVMESGHPRIKLGSVARPVPGWDVQLLTADSADHDEHHGHNHENEEQDQELVVKLPLPPGALTTLHNNPDDFHAKYFKRFPGYYHTGDTGRIDEEGFVYVMSRTDDVINVAGHRITTGSIEEVIIEIPEVVECAVFGVADTLKGHIPVALLVIDKKLDRPKDEIAKQVVRDVREQMGSFVCLKEVGMVTALPKTRSGKVMRATIQAIADSAPFRVPATIENVAVLDDIREVLKKLGYAKKKSVVVGK
ncbi:hypothetical protein BBJ29_005513 [Phytophthora kernoviae]|uniref:Propionate--CoA ligase n=1 Tax=Phytophthora kernoviae TaxID=325452 RepID=A0A3F2RP06_9STRA|nr:hypothetical protein BBJ29_005513 [Phytophthora kernoviae]RLN61077.1 hypothetical protein BBP00_00005631 [Phytophthora kernoviae]